MIKYIVKTSAVFLISLLLSNSAFAQFDCRSILGAHLTPIKKEVPLYWGIEGIGSYGKMIDREIVNAMLFGGLEYDFGKSRIYVEGGYKAWRNSKGFPGKDNLGEDHAGPKYFQKNRLGFREFFYNYKAENFSLIGGLHSMTSGDYFLMNERAMGLTANINFGAFTVKSNIATVNRNFARMGTFCGVRYLYNTIHTGYEILPGEKFGETNIAGAVILWNPHYKKPIVEELSADEDGFKSADEDEFGTVDEDEFKSTDDDEFSDVSNDVFSSAGDEFSDSGDEFSEVEKPKQKILKNVGALVFDEFGSYFIDNKIFIGAMLEIEPLSGVTVKVEPVLQLMNNNNSLGYFATISKGFNWNKGHRSTVEAGYLGKISLSDSAMFIPSFSNLYMGEVMRMDTWDAPLAFGSIKHNFPGKLHLYAKVRAALQIEQYHTQNYDLEIGFKAFNHARLSSIFSMIESDALEQTQYMARVELRIAF